MKGPAVDIVNTGDNIENPLVSVIVPNYNHAAFLRDRLSSIFRQTYQNIEVIILDDCSSDNSHEVIQELIAGYEGNAVFVPNETNSGNVFRQWRKGCEMAKGDLVWICESDDYAEIDFLERMVPHFRDLAVMIAFGRIQFMDEHSNVMHGLDQYRERAQPNIWGGARSAPAHEWFAHAFSVLNVIPNVGGSLFRRQDLEQRIWETAETYSILGDWYLYLELARGGKLAYDNAATTYFRQHGNNTSSPANRKALYYEEHERVALAIRNRWSVSDDITWQLYSQLKTQFENGGGLPNAQSLVDVFSVDGLLRSVPDRLHVLIGFLGFHVGGGEFFPIHLANELRSRGILVSMLYVDDSHVQPEMWDLLDSRIPVYHGDDVRKVGPVEFLRNACIDIVHSHHIGIEGLFFLENEVTETLPFISSLHGSYEVSEVWEYGMSTICRGVQHWVYTADKNTKHLDSRSWITAPTTKLSNGMPIAPGEWSKSRSEMGIGEDTFVYILVARPIPEKGWEDAITATVQLHQSGEDVALILVGADEYQEELEKEWGSHPAIHFLGFQTEIYQLLRFSDCCLLPTRFLGESYPLILIQAIQTGTPSIATAAGNIPTMLVSDASSAGIVIPWLDDDLAYVDVLKRAMLEVREPMRNAQLVEGTKERTGKYSMERVANDYVEIYASTIARLQG